VVFIIATNVGQLDNWLRREFAASGYSGTVVITLWLAGYRCVRPSATPAKTNWLTNVCGTATAVNSLDERQNSASAEYPRRTSAKPGACGAHLKRTHTDRRAAAAGRTRGPRRRPGTSPLVRGVKQHRLWHRFIPSPRPSGCTPGNTSRRRRRCWGFGCGRHKGVRRTFDNGPTRAATDGRLLVKAHPLISPFTGEMLLCGV
jgi:hypothetical protein